MTTHSPLIIIIIEIIATIIIYHSSIAHHADGDALAVEQAVGVVGHAAQPLHRVPHRVAPVEDAPQPRLLRILRSFMSY